MASISYRLNKWISKQINNKLNSLAQTSTTATGEKRTTEGMADLARQAAAEGIVLLKNDGVLPLAADQKLSVFGRCQIDSFYVGYGSGGDVKAPYYVSYLDAMLEAEAQGKLSLNHNLVDTYRAWAAKPENEPNDGFWGHWPMSYPLWWKKIQYLCRRHFCRLSLL